MIQRCDRSRLAIESLEKLRVARAVGAQHFDGDRPIEANVASAIDLSHAARADERCDLVGPSRVPDAIDTKIRANKL